MSIKTNISYSVIFGMLNVLFPIVTVPYISRVLGAENVGVVRFVITCVSYFMLFAAFGIGYYGVREVAKYKNNQKKCSQIFSSLFTITLFSTLISTLIFLLCINLVSEFKEHRLLFSVYGIVLYTMPIASDWYFQAKENFKMIAIRSFIINVLMLTLMFVFVRERSDVVPYILLSVFVFAATRTWNLSYAYKTGLRISLRNLEIRRHIKPMFVFLCLAVAVNAFAMIDVAMLGFLTSYSQVGYYTSASFIITAIVGCFGAINTALLPRLSFNSAQKEDNTNVTLLQKTFNLNALLIVPLAVGLCLIASRFIPLFLGGEFMGSIVPMQILSFKVIVVVINSFFGFSVLMALGHEKRFLTVSACAAMLSLALNYLLIPQYGAMGAAIVAVLVEGFAIGISLYFVYKYTQIRVRWNTVGIAMFFTLPLFALYYFCNKWLSHDVMFLCVFICLSIMVYFALLLLAKNDLAWEVVKIGRNKLRRN